MKSIRTPEIEQEIIERLSAGEPLEQICRDEHMPAVRTVNDWRAADERLSADIARARILGFDAIAESCLEIADDGRNDWMERQDSNGGTSGWSLNGEHVQRSKLRVETRLKLLAKWDPTRYGDQQKVELTGANGGPIDNKWTVEFIRPKDAEATGSE